MEWVLAVERAYVAAATRPAGWRQVAQPPIPPSGLPRALAAIGAVASHYLAVSMPRTFGVILGSADQLELARLSIEAHRVWFSPREIRCALLDGTQTSELGPAVTIHQALAADIVCVHAPIRLEAAKLRRGTHLNVLVASAGGVASVGGVATLDDDLAQLATVVPEMPGLGRLAAGLVDGRRLDELTVFLAGDAQIALHALAALP